MSKFTWVVDEKELRYDVRLNLPKDWKLRVFKVTSGDTGKEYWVQWLRRDYSLMQEILICGCPEGYFKAPLTVLGLKEFHCKHVSHVQSVVKWKG